MKRLFAALAIALSLASPAHAAYFQAQTYLPAAAPNPNLRQENFFGLTGSAWQNPSAYYVPGTGNPAVSTADNWHVDGAMWARPYDLTASDCGATGASIAASRGRYVWMVSHDHSVGSPWTDGSGMALGYSNDPGVPPKRVDFFYRFERLTPFAQIASVTAKIDNGSGGAGNILTVSVVANGTISANSNSVVDGAGVTQATIITQTSGTNGGVGTYTLTGAAQNIPAQAMTISQPDFKVGQGPWLVCNPDDVSFPFYVSSEGQASSTGLEAGFTKSADLITWTDALPSFVNYTFNGFSGYQKIVRTGVNAWYSTGFQGGFPQTSNALGFAKWTSINGTQFTPNPSTLFNSCLPANASGVFGSIPCTQTNSVQFESAGAPPRVTVSSQDYTVTRANTTVSTVRVGNQWASRAPIDANFNIISSPARVDISAPYAGIYPGPSYVAAVNAYGPEDGILHYYVQTGFPPSNGQLNGTASARPYLNGGACVQSVNGTFAFTGYIDNGSGSAGNTLHVTATTTAVPVNGQIMFFSGSPAFITAQVATQPGDVATYTIDGSTQLVTSQSISVATCGGLLQQGIDYFTEIVDATAAAGAAPVGVQASCANSVASLTWFNALPTQTYRIYRGTTAGSQPTLVGDFTGTSATDSGMTLNAVTYYKLVYLNSGVEKKNRVVSTWCSSSIYPEVNAHFTRVQAAGADMTTCSQTFMDSFYGWLTSNGLKNNLLFATMPEFCVAKSGSTISKVFDMGSTRFERGGDYTPTTSNTTYNATGINSKPAWVNGTSSAYGYYGSGRLNNIRRKTQITLLAAYQKPGTGAYTPFVIGGGTVRTMLTHSSGTPGGISCLLSDATQQKTATATVSGLATDVHTAGCTFDGTTWLAYSDAVAGSGQTGLVIPSPTLSPADMLTGQIDNNVTINTNVNVLFSGSDQGQYSVATGYHPSAPQAQSSVRGHFVFDKNLTGAQIMSWDTLVR